MRAGLLALFALLLPALAAAAPPTIDMQARDQTFWLPEQVGGTNYEMFTRLCRPDGPAPSRVMVFSHGRAPDALGRGKTQPVACSGEMARFFLARGYMIVAPVRPGYGRTGGSDIESDRCNALRDYTRGAFVAATAIDTALDFALSLPFARHDGVLVVGQSAGGLATIAYASRPRPEVTAVINMAGGNGGHLDNMPNQNCFPNRLADAAGRLGASSRIPELWVYAANDSFFAPPIAEAMYRAFTAAGGKAVFEQPGPFGNDGHRLFLGRGGAAVWGPMVERYLAARP